ncbi:MAG: hypothetical protein OXE50_16585, partial [Chloroflexi bacterium]|nr:hypothetical protein [Chloroflexota bacterium]
MFKQLLNKFKNQPDTIVDIFVDTLGERGRDSVIDPKEPFYGPYNIIEPDEKFKQSIKGITPAELVKMGPSETIRTLVESVPLLNVAVEAFQYHAVPGYRFESPDQNESDVALVEEAIESIGGETVFTSFMTDCVYGMVAENGFCAEQLFSEDGTRFTGFTYISPYTLSFEKREHEDLGEYWVTGQRNVYQRDLNVLYDPAYPDDYKTFIYTPTNKKGNRPYGSSQLMSGLYPAASLHSVITTTVDFLKKQAYPKGIVSIDTQPWIEAGLSKEEIFKRVAIAKQMLEGKLKAADVAANFITSLQVIYTLVGQADVRGISGIEFLAEELKRDIGVAAKIPRVMTGAKRSGQSLTSEESRYDWLYFVKRLLAIRAIMTANIDKFIKNILEHAGRPDAVVNLIIDEWDIELKRIYAEYLKLLAESMKA